LLKLGDVRDSRILNAPNLLRKLLGVRHQGRLRVDPPPIDAVRRSRGAEVRQAGPVFNAAQQQRISVGQRNSRRIEDAVDGIGPILSAENRVAGLTLEQGTIYTWLSLWLVLDAGSNNSAGTIDGFKK
jgi:hypothetical protein